MSLAPSLSALKEVAAVPADAPPENEALKLLLTARRLQEDETWSRIEVIRQEVMPHWLIRAWHFDESFETCRQEVVVPVDQHDTLSGKRHELLVESFGISVVNYAIIDGDGDVILYCLRPAPLLQPPDLRPLSEPAPVSPSVLAAAASDDATVASSSGGGGGGGGGRAKRRAAAAARQELVGGGGGTVKRRAAAAARHEVGDGGGGGGGTVNARGQVEQSKKRKNQKSV
eukprot:TRINITY_DN27886_c0_g1_i1.p1 TRINITY_DN27886_c0_g1~~TRINITY_DN27886_c0_g1_i1.p1  ORF type:complete len:229 (-),score=58.57 TRINITY_DN27886_c0_g1_i1:458-1144(-)